VHVGFADPFCPRGRSVAIASARAAGKPVADAGTLVVINGPRFSSAAESRWHQEAGWSIVGMTAMPEAALARELAMCFTTVALVTDHDAGVDGGTAVTHEEVLAVFGANVEGLKSVLKSAVAAMPADESDETATCACRRALDGIALPFALPV
jgi:5'-methylthioadenosine phosphorylase